MILVEITETGRKTANDFRPIVHQHQKEWLEVLGETEQTATAHCRSPSLIGELTGFQLTNHATFMH
jgi:hypothetical protein